MAPGRRWPLPGTRPITMDGRQLLEDDRERVGFDWSTLGSGKPSELGIRFAFGAAIALAAGVAGRGWGPRAGGAVFPPPPRPPPAPPPAGEQKRDTTARRDGARRRRGRTAGGPPR